MSFSSPSQVSFKRLRQGVSTSEGAIREPTSQGHGLYNDNEGSYVSDLKNTKIVEIYKWQIVSGRMR